MDSNDLAEINHTELEPEIIEFIKRQIAAASYLLEQSWRATLRKERDARLHENRLKERYKAEVAQLKARIETMQRNIEKEKYDVGGQ